MPEDNIRRRRKEEKAQPKNQSKDRRPFVRLPRELATHPPIQHRGKHELEKVDVFEYVIAAAIVDLAYEVIVPQQYEHAIRAGKRAMDDCQVGSRKQETGMVAYDWAWKEFKPPAVVTITVSARQLFRAAGLSRAGNLARLPATLHRLREQRVGRLPPLLRSFSKASNGRWTLEVDSRWTPTQSYARVPWPPPTHQGGATTLSLYPFLFVINHQDHQVSIRAEELCRRLGIRTGLGSHARRDLDHALAGVNKHLRKLNKDGALDQLRLVAAFELVPMHGGARIHFCERRADTVSEQEMEYNADIETMRHREREQEESRRSQQEWDDRAYFGNMAKRLRGER